MEELYELLIDVNGVQLRWNVAGVDPSGTIDLDRFAVHLFTVDFSRGRGGFDAPLGREEVRRLHSFLAPFATQLEEAAPRGRLRVVESTLSIETVLTLLAELDDAALSTVLNSIGTSERLAWLAENLSSLKRDELEASLRHARRQTALEHLQALVDEDTRQSGDVVALCRSGNEYSAYEAGKPETVFQRWFEANPWVLGREYVRRHSLRVIGLDSEADLVMETSEGYLDLVELKRPVAKVLAFKQGSRTDQGFYHLHSDLSVAYGQCVRYLADLERFRYQLQEEYSARIVAPRVFLIIGRSNEAEREELDALRRIEATFHQVHLLTYDQVLEMGRQLIRELRAT